VEAADDERGPATAEHGRRRRGRVLVKVLWGAATNRVSLAFSTAGAMGALLFQSGALCAMAAGGYLLAVAVDLGRATRWRAAIQEVRREPPPLPSSLSFVDLVARTLMGRIERARADRVDALASPALATFAGVDTLAETAAELERSAGLQLVLLDRLGRLLGVEPIAPLRTELLRLERVADVAAPAPRAEYERALKALHERLRSLEQAATSRALLLARLEGVVAGLEGLPTRLVALELQQSTLLLGRGPAVEELLAELQALEQAVRSGAGPDDGDPGAGWSWPTGLGAVAG
jgi:hypothetical protein